MFSYQLPDGGLRTNSYFNAEGQIKFEPPVYEQRYTTAIRILEDERWKQHFKKVVDFGCAEMRILPLLRRIDTIEHIIEVDIDEILLQSNQQRAVPLVSDYLQKRENPLRVEIFKGSIDASVEEMRNVDAILAIEIIEHLYANVLEKVPENIFGFIQPKLAIFSTPNSDFNVLFGPLLPNGFRHLDHKFEWNRAEFKEWTKNICQRYPNYKVAIIGVGKAPPDQKKFGHVTQIAIFARKDILDEPLAEPLKDDIPANLDPDVQYKEIFANDFPFNQDERTKEEKIWDEARYKISNSRNVERFFNREKNVIQLPLAEFKDYLESVSATEDELRIILKDNKIVVEGDFIILPEYDEENVGHYSYGDDCYDDCNDDEYGWNAASGDEEELAAGGKNTNASSGSEENWD